MIDAGGVYPDYLTITLWLGVALAIVLVGFALRMRIVTKNRNLSVSGESVFRPNMGSVVSYTLLYVVLVTTAVMFAYLLWMSDKEAVLATDSKLTSLLITGFLVSMVVKFIISCVALRRAFLFGGGKFAEKKRYIITIILMMAVSLLEIVPFQMAAQKIQG